MRQPVPHLSPRPGLVLVQAQAQALMAPMRLQQDSQPQEKLQMPHWHSVLAQDQLRIQPLENQQRDLHHSLGQSIWAEPLLDSAPRH